MRAPPAHPAPAPAPARLPWRRLLLLAALVLAVHALLIGPWLAGCRRIGSGPGAAARPMLLVPPAPLSTPVPRRMAGPPPDAAAADPADATAAAVVPPAVTTRLAPGLPAPQAGAPAPPAAAAGPGPGAEPGDTAAATLALRPPASAPQAAPDADPETESGPPPPPAEGTPPPVYATRVPLPVLLRFQVLQAAGDGSSPGVQGEALLQWRHDGQRYQLQLDAQALGRPLLEQASRGGFDAAGLAPERFTDRRRGRGWRAANFRRDAGRIGFSGPRIDYPLLPGTQDRLSALAQLVAIVAAAPATPPAGGIQMFVADARGWAETWHWQPGGAEAVDTPLGTLNLAHWRREPARPEGLRVEAWLDAARGHWPARLRFTLLRSGQVLDLLLAAEPTSPP